MTSRASGGRAAVLELDPRLARLLTPADVQKARRELTTPLVRVAPGPWSPHDFSHAAARLLVVRGLLLRAVALDGVEFYEPLADGDVLGRIDLLRRRPVLHHGPALLHATFTWHAATPLLLAVLDPMFMRHVKPWPLVLTELSARSVARTQRRAVLHAIAHIRSAERRTYLALVLMAESWGRREAEGLALPFRLTHETIGRLIGADRPTVSIALKHLREAGRIRVRPDRRIVLIGAIGR